MTYYIWRDYAPHRQKLPTEDLLEAVKISINYEADLYIGGYLLVSWLCLPMEENKMRLEQKGIETYIVKDQYCFRYQDSEKNIKKFYYDIIDLQDGEGELHIDSIPGYTGHQSYSSFDELIKQVKEKYPQFKVLTIVDFSGDVFEGSYNFDMRTMEKVEKSIVS